MVNKNKNSKELFTHISSVWSSKFVENYNFALFGGNETERKLFSTLTHVRNRRRERENK